MDAVDVTSDSPHPGNLESEDVDAWWIWAFVAVRCQINEFTPRFSLFCYKLVSYVIILTNNNFLCVCDYCQTKTKTTTVFYPVALEYHSKLWFHRLLTAVSFYHFLENLSEETTAHPIQKCVKKEKKTKDFHHVFHHHNTLWRQTFIWALNQEADIVRIVFALVWICD